MPTWRLDVDREIDLIEEVGRIYGYLKLPNTLPAFAGAVIPLPNAEKQATLRQRLLALGYNESISSTFISAEEVRAYSSVEAGAAGESSERGSRLHAKFACARYGEPDCLQPQSRQ